MSRAFVNEDAGADRPDLPELPVSPGPNIVTPRGLAALHERIAQRQADLAALKSRPDRLDKLQAAFDAHMHATAATGPPSPPTPVVGLIPVGALAPVAAAKVKAE